MVNSELAEPALFEDVDDLVVGLPRVRVSGCHVTYLLTHPDAVTHGELRR